MDEKKENNEEKKESTTTPEDTTEGIQQQAITELDRADQIAQMQKRENDRREDLITREEALQARRMVGGVAEAGQTKPKEKEESPEEYAMKVLAGKYND